MTAAFGVIHSEPEDFVPANRDMLEQIALRIAPSDARVEHLGTGGFACTFRVTTADEVYALKVIDPDLGEAERVERELAALQRVDHPGVVRFREVGSYTFGDVEYRWIKMNFVEGHTLRASLDGGEVFSIGDSIRLTRALVDAANAIWDQGTAHRDLTPRNIMLRADATPVIVDLGLARHVDDESMTALPTPGTPGWMSPEQVSSSPTHGDWRSDQFVLGSIAYLLLTGVAPFYSRNGYDCWVAPLKVTPRPIRSVVPAVPAPVAEIVERMMHKQPHRRYLKIAELLADLDAASAAWDEAAEGSGELAEYYPTIGDLKSWAADGFLRRLGAHGTIISAQVGDRTKEFVEETVAAGGTVVSDPSTWLTRSPLSAQKKWFQKLPYGGLPPLTGFADDATRRAWSQSVWDWHADTGGDVYLTPYFYAGEGELNWVSTSLACASDYRDFASSGLFMGELWTSVLVHSAWLSDNDKRDQLLTLLTGQQMTRLYLLVHTPQPSFAPLADVDTLRGLRDLLDVMRDASVPVVVGKRASSGLLLLAMGAQGWGIGPRSSQMNSAPHPEAPIRARQPIDRVYIPQLMTQIAAPAFALIARRYEQVADLGTPEGNQVMSENPGLETLTPQQRILLNQHNRAAQHAQASRLSGLPAGQRISLMREWISEAAETAQELPPLRDNLRFLSAWEAALS